MAKFLLIGSGIVLIIVAALAYYHVSSAKRDTAGNLLTPQTETENGSQNTTTTQASAAVTYGYWTDKNAVVASFNLVTKNNTPLATLPLSVKKITPISASKFLFINNTDSYDHGSEIVLYDSQTKTANVVLQASSGFGIDDFVVSPNGRYLADWEVKFAPNTTILQGGASRVFSTDITSKQPKNAIYDEVSSKTQPVHYPRAITNNGNIYVDLFLPNTGAGWAYGMSETNFSGTQKQDLTAMQNGSYGTQPDLSPNGAYLAFAGYDGNMGNGTAINDGFRQALVTPDTVELLDTAKNNRIKLANLPNSNTYTRVSWDKQQPQTLIIDAIDRNTYTNKTYTYNVGSKTLKSVTLPQDYTYIAGLSNGNALIGQRQALSSAMGNLGSSYSTPFGSLAIFDSATSKIQPVSQLSSPVQIITTTFASVPSQAAKPNNSAGKNLQLDTFTVAPSKKTLTDTRTKQQTNPQTTPQPSTTVPNQNGDQPCRNLAAKQCGVTIPPGVDPWEAIIGQGFFNNIATPAQAACMIHADDPAHAGGACLDSPLYLYGPEGTIVNVHIQTPFFSSNVPQSGDGYTVLVHENKTMTVGKVTTTAISYDYLSAKPFNPPKDGIVASKNTIAQVLSFYSLGLGLNEKETADVINFGESHFKTSPYVFVSVLDQELSKQVLPLQFDPQPNSYSNIIFYFQELSNLPLSLPKIPAIYPIERTGPLSAVEISEIVNP